MAESSSKKQSAASHLPDDLVIDILSRVPYRSLCRFKCVSRSWLALCSDPDLRKKSAQTLSGFFHHSIVPGRHGPYARHFTNLSGRGRPMIDPSLPFLPSYTYAEFIDCCNGLLLLECWKMSSELESEYVVCNPATEKWIVLPHTEGMRRPNITRLGFDPAVSSHFCVFLLNDARPNGDMHNWNGYIQVIGVEIYSSETGGWTYRQSEWTDDGRGLEVRVPGSSVFFNGTLHLTAHGSSVITVDMVGKTWRIIPTPHNFHFIGLSQGCLYSARIDYYNGPPLSFWILEDYDSEEWILKHTVSPLELFDGHHLQFVEYNRVIAIHPEQNLVFLTVGMHPNIVSYNMDNRMVHVICTLGENHIHPYLPYMPCFSEWLSGGH